MRSIATGAGLFLIIVIVAGALDLTDVIFIVGKDEVAQYKMECMK